MNLGDGLLFELENGKPKLILCSHGVAKNPAKLPSRPRVANVLSPRQPSCLEEAGRYREARSKAAAGAAAAAAASLHLNAATAGERGATLNTSKAHEHHVGGCIKTVAKVRSDGHKQAATVGSLRTNGKMGKPPSSRARAGAGGKAGLKAMPVGGEAGRTEGVVALTSGQLQQILDSLQTTSNDRQPPEDHQTQGSCVRQSGTSVNEGEGETKEGDRGGEVMEKGQGGGGVTDTAGTSQEKDIRSSGCLFSWMEERQSDTRSAIDAKKAQWRRQLDEQVVLKQQQQQQWRPAPGRIQEEDTERVLSVQSSLSHRQQPAAITSSLKLGEVTPMEQVLGTERKEEQRRRWLEELDRQREEMTERRRREKLLQSQTEDHEHWCSHFDSLQRRPPGRGAAPSAPTRAPSRASEGGEWEPSSSLSLVWDATSSCRADSVGGASVDTTNGYLSGASYLRTMTALLDPAQIEERERRRLKQQEQQRAIDAQVEERRVQREREKAKRREEEEEEARRLQSRYQLDAVRQKVQQEEQRRKDNDEGSLQETLKPSTVSRQDERSVEEGVISSVPPYKDTAVQTEASASLPLRAEGVQTPDVSAQYQPPAACSAAPLTGRKPAARAGKENICLPRGGGGGGGGGGRGRGRGEGGGGEDPYEAFARTERSSRRPEWNTQRPSRRFVPASERYPPALQRDRQESRLKRQAELHALQERTCLSRTEPLPLPPPLRLCPDPTQTRGGPNSKVETVARVQSISAAINNERVYYRSRESWSRDPNPELKRHDDDEQLRSPSSTQGL
ncbi:putative coiled-coil domain-containing protein 66 [Scophthalmus maximus]|uniref:Putative coiled-coil domain-containing protein 66 n=1 Tax=Scophthalmus maximus TaxID=52904 RepID=A0A2U9BEP6_SCOMX|nr:putative coiled-coil domain-containing protein 66 [Scophthalmus maximus]